VERLVDGVEHGLDILLQYASLVVVDGSDVVLDDVLVGSAKLSRESGSAQPGRVNELTKVKPPSHICGKDV
jgi:hypothetical protein